MTHVVCSLPPLHQTVTKYMSDRLPQLRHVFEKYSSMASDQGLPDNRDTVNLLEFCQVRQAVSELHRRMLIHPFPLLPRSTAAQGLKDAARH